MAVIGAPVRRSRRGRRVPGQADSGDIDRHEQQQEARAAHGGDHLKRARHSRHEGEDSGNQRPFKMLVTHRPFGFPGKLAVANDDVGQAPGALEDRIDRRTCGHQDSNHDGDIPGPAQKILRRHREHMVTDLRHLYRNGNRSGNRSSFEWYY
jgi:hypothetical protein